MKKTVYLACFLAVLCAITGTLLSWVNSITSPIIEANGIATEKVNLELIYPGANFSEVENTDTTGYVIGVYEAEGLGYVYKIEASGYSSTPFQFLLAFNNDGTVGGYQVLSQSETNGFGARCFEDDYSNQVKALTSSDAFPLLSGATLTSTGVTNGINAAKALFNESQGIEYDPNAVSEPAAAPKGEAMSMSDDYATYKAEVTDNGDGSYAVTARGFGLIDPNGIAGETGHEYSRNEFVVKVTDGAIDSIEFTKFGDTEGIGDVCNKADFLDTFKGATLDSSIDAITGATWTSKSVVAAAQAALNAGNE